MTAAATFDFNLGDDVRVNLAGRVVARTEFLDAGGVSYLVQSTRNGKIVNEWIGADRLVAADANQVPGTKTGATS